MIKTDVMIYSIQVYRKTDTNVSENRYKPNINKPIQNKGLLSFREAFYSYLM